MIYFADTSAILDECSKLFTPVWTCLYVVSELENIKTNPNKDDHTKYLARQAVRDIIFNSKYEIFQPDIKQIKKVVRQHSELNDINDHYILAVAYLLQKEKKDKVLFITHDGTQYLLAQALGLTTYYYETHDFNDEYTGWHFFTPTADQLTSLYTTPDKNVLDCQTNEFAEICCDGILKDVLFWDGAKYRPLKYKDMKNPYLDEILKPRNLEQKMAFDLIQNKDIKVKLLTSAWGSGKTLIALTYALEQVWKGNYQKLIFVRNNIIVADTNDIGFLPGNVQEKMSIWGAPLADHLGGQVMLDKLIDDGTIEIYPLSHMRGRSINNSIVLCDECENMNDKLVTFLMSRIEKDSEIIFCGDVAQIDHRKFEKNNGIRAMLNALAGDPLFGTVKLIKSERGKVAELCNKIRPPV